MTVQQESCKFTSKKIAFIPEVKYVDNITDIVWESPKDRIIPESSYGSTTVVLYYS